MKNFLFTSEAVTEGHPDKICDLISDTILDTALMQDENSKMAVEAIIKDDFILIYGEANTNAIIDYKEIALTTLKNIGYKEKYNVLVKVGKQSQEINNAVTEKNSNFLAAGDQGIMFGYACDETDALMPAPIYYANKLAKQLSIIQKKYDFLGPDGKTQVTVEYYNEKVKRIDTIIISCMHSPYTTQPEIKTILHNEVIKKIIPQNLLDDESKIIINPSGSFTIGGSFGDSGTTGRKIVCDTYGGMGRVGGGCLSSKDPTKVDRSAAYYCRYVAKNLVAYQLAKRVEVQVSYAIGKKEPVSLCIDTFGTGKVEDEEILKIVKTNFNFSVDNIIKELNLKRPIYHNTSCYGHFGRSEFPWEKIKHNLKI